MSWSTAHRGTPRIYPRGCGPPRSGHPSVRPVRRSKGEPMIKLVTAIIKPHMLDSVKDSLRGTGVQGLTVTEVRGFGRQGGHTETYRGSEYTVDLVPKLRLEILCAIDEADRVMETIRASAHT